MCKNCKLKVLFEKYHVNTFDELLAYLDSKMPGGDEEVEIIDNTIEEGMRKHYRYVR